LFSTKGKNIAREFYQDIEDGVFKTCLGIKAILSGIEE